MQNLNYKKITITLNIIVHILQLLFKIILKWTPTNMFGQMPKYAMMHLYSLLNYVPLV